MPSAPLARRVVGPLYDLGHLKSHVDAAFVRLMTSKCITHVAKLGWTVNDVVQLIGDLYPSDYHCSEWCEASARFFVDCDVYTLHYNVKTIERDLSSPEFYVKFGARQNSRYVVIISCHESQYA